MNKLVLVVLLIPWIAGCATADLSGFASQTSALMVSIQEEQQAIAVKMDEVGQLTALAEKEGWFKEPVFPSEDGTAENDVALLAQTYKHSQYVQMRTDFANRAAAIQQTLDAISAYATALSELAQAGESGRDAVDKSVSALNTIASSLQGPAALIGGPAVEIVKEIADLVTRAQAQESIGDAMAVLAGHDGALRKTVVLLQQLLDLIEDRFVYPVHRQLIVLEQYRHGPGLISFYEDSSTWMHANRSYYLLRMESEAQKEYLRDTTERKLYSALRACLADQKGCPQASLASGLAARLLLQKSIEEEYRAFDSAKRRANEWRNLRVARIEQVRTALNAWADEHDAIYQSIKTCGGFKAVKPACGNWSEANLRLSVEKIRRVIPDASAEGGAK